MDIYWYGQACFKIKGKNASVLIDPYDPVQLGLKLPKDLISDLAIKTHDHFDHSNLDAASPEAIRITGPGQYEVKGVAVTGVATFHDDKQGEERGRNTIYNIEIDGVKIVHLGDLGQKALTEEQLEELGSCDILLIPVGAVYTIDAKDAANIVTQMEPRIVIPMHYSIEGLKVELEPVDNFLKEMAIEKLEPIPKLAITREKLPDETQVVLLSKS